MDIDLCLRLAKPARIALSLQDKVCGPTGRYRFNHSKAYLALESRGNRSKANADLGLVAQRRNFLNLIASGNAGLKHL